MSRYMSTLKYKHNTGNVLNLTEYLIQVTKKIHFQTPQYNGVAFLFFDKYRLVC